MKQPSLAGRLRETSALVALSAAAIVGCASPSSAANTITTGIFGGGSTLASQALRQLFDCYMGHNTAMTDPANSTVTFTDGFTFTTGSTLKPGFLPKNCTSSTHANLVEGLYAAVGSGSGQAAFFANDPNRLLQSKGQTPATPPPFVDINNTGADASTFGSYPYPSVPGATGGLSFGAGDSPLGAKTSNGNGYSATIGDLTSTDWTSFTPTSSWQTTTTIAVGPTTTVTYPTPSTSWGEPIQIPMFEAPVAIIININSMTVQTSLSPDTKAGGAIALTTAQLCAIFSGLVTDWSDTTTLIPYLDNTGHQLSQSFWAANAIYTGTGTMQSPITTPTAYASSPLPIKVVFRSDGSGTSFIITNFLKSACPQLDTSTSTTSLYHSIYNDPSIPTTGFGSASGAKIGFQLLVSKFYCPAQTSCTTDPTTNWIGLSGSAAVAAGVNNDAPNAGHIGYVSADFSSPYAPPSVTTTPLSASLQNEGLRAAGYYLPDAGKYVAPTSASVDAAFAVTAPTTTSTWAKWDVYGITYGTKVNHGVTITGKSELGLPLLATAYPISGTTFAYLYSCYASAAQTTALGDWLAWLLGSSVSGLSLYNNTVNNRSHPGHDAINRYVSK